jgi:hypothetical protein
MAVTQLQRIAAQLDLNRSTVTLTRMRLGHLWFDDDANATGFARLLQGRCVSAVAESFGAHRPLLQTILPREGFAVFAVVLRHDFKLVSPNRDKFACRRRCKLG